MRSTRRTLALAIVVLAVVLVAGCVGLGDGPGANGDVPEGDESWPEPPDDVEVEYLENTTATFVTGSGNVTVTLEVAATSSEKRAGLSNRASLPADHGMVFVYDEPDDLAFVMRDTYVPLDIVFLDADRTVTSIEEADPEPDVPRDELTRYTSEEPSQYVIEFEQGYADDHDIEPGTEVVFHDELREDEGIVD